MEEQWRMLVGLPVRRGATAVVRVGCVPIMAMLCVLSAPQSARADTGYLLPERVKQGFQAYRGSDGARAAVDRWVSGGPLGRIVKPDVLVGKLHSIEALCGEYEDYEVSRIDPLSSRSRIVYLVVNYRQCPVFTRFVSYRTGDDWVITEFNMRTKPEEVFPANLLAPARQ